MTTVPRHPLVIIAVSQIAAAIVAFGSAFVMIRLGGPMLPWLAIASAWGGLAAALGYRFGLRSGWLMLQILLPVLLILGMRAPVPAWAYLAVFAVLLAVQWNAARGRVPLYLTNRTTWDALVEQMPDLPGLQIVDLGSGLGGTVIELARRLPESHVLGIESAPMPYLLSKIRVAVSGQGGRAAIVYGDYRNHDLGAFDVVYCFLSPVPMPELFARASREMKPGSLLISNSFTVPEHPAERIVDVDDRRHTRLHIWCI